MTREARSRKARIRLWEVVGLDPLNKVIVFYNSSIKRYKDYHFISGSVTDHPYYDVDYIYPSEHNKHKTAMLLKEMREENKGELNTRLIRED
jgi:hypothetical protein